MVLTILEGSGEGPTQGHLRAFGKEGWGHRGPAGVGEAGSARWAGRGRAGSIVGRGALGRV